MISASRFARRWTLRLLPVLLLLFPIYGQVNFSEASPNPAPIGTWCVAGAFQGWDNNSTALFDDGTNGDVTSGDGIYTREYTVASAGRSEFKFLECENWGNTTTTNNSWFDTASPNTIVTFTLNTNILADGGVPSQRIGHVGGDVDPTTFTAVGDWQVPAWNNESVATTLTSLGGGIYQGVFDIATPGSYKAKVVITGTWDGYDNQGRQLSTPLGGEIGFTTTEVGEDVTFRLDLNSDRLFITTESAPPPAWDSIYHSSCSSYFSTDCTGGDHAAQQQVPGQPTGTTFSSVNVAGSSVGTTNVFGYDDEGVTMYAIGDTGQFTDDTDYPRVRFWNGTSEQFTNMDIVGSFTGSFNSRSSNYDVFSGTLPAYSPRTIYYWVTMRYGSTSTNLGLCRGGNPANDVGQPVSAGNNCSFNDYAFDILDDDTSGPAITNVVFDDGGNGLGNGNEQVCADVVETGTDSGDNDSAIATVDLLYSSVLGDLLVGNGTRVTMPFSADSTYCANNLNIADGTYYLVEAQNNDLDHPTTQDYTDIDTTSSAPVCVGISCSPLTTDNNIMWNEVLHNTRDNYYRTPFGAVTAGSNVTLRLRTAKDDIQFAYVRVYNGANGNSVHQMTRVGTDASYDYYEAAITPTDTATPRQIYYKFQLIDGTDEDWYVDNHTHNEYDHEDRYENGTGLMIDDGANPAYANNSFTMTVYDGSFDSTVASWVQNAVIYQIMPDRFRNGDPSNDEAWPADYTVYGNPPFLHDKWNEAPINPREAGDNFNFWSADFFGGDLQGITDELDYLQSLGVTAIYLNPVFSSPSNHGYDTTDYYNINPRYGDNVMFELFAQEAEARGIHIILDGVFNHTGSDSVYFDRYNRWGANGNPATGNDGSGACENGSSPYNVFYNFTANGLGPCSDGRSYESWFGYDSLPVTIDYVSGNAWRDFVFDFDNDDDNGLNTNPGIIQFWYELGADGWRFDVANEIPHDFWVEFRDQVKTNDDFYGPLITEVWYEAQPWLLGNELDATMNYRYRKAVLGFLVDSTFTDNDSNGDQTMYALTPSEFDYVLGSIREDYPEIAWQSMMNLMGSHDTNRALFVLGEKSVDLNTAIQKLEMMAALQFTYPGAPTIYYGDEAGLGAAAYGGYGNWGAGFVSDSILQDDPYNRHTFPWNPNEQDDYNSWNGSGNFDSVTGPVPPTDTYSDGLYTHYSILGTTRNSYEVLRTGDVITLLTDDANNVYAYARTNATTCAIAIFNRSAATRNVTLNGLPSICQNTPYFDVLNNGASWSSTNSITVNNIPSITSVVLVPALGTNNLRLPPAAVNVTTNNVNAAYINTRTITATVTDITGNPLPAGVSLNFSVVSGGGTINATASTNASGQASVTFNAPNYETVSVIEARILGTNGVTYRGTTSIYVAYGASVVDSHTENTSIGPDFVDGFGAGLPVAVTKIGNGEPVVSLAQFSANPYEGSSPVASAFVDVKLSDSDDVEMLAIRVQYTDETNEASHTLYWWDGLGWVEVNGFANVDTTANEVVFEVDGLSSPRLDQLRGTTFVVGNPGYYVPQSQNAFTIGAWTTTDDINANGGSFMCTTGGEMVLGFTGTTVDIIHVQDTIEGSYNVNIDSTYDRTVNVTSGTRSFITESVPVTGAGYHVLRIVHNSGTVCIDSFNVAYDETLAPLPLNLIDTTSGTDLGTTLGRADCRINYARVILLMMQDATSSSYEMSVAFLVGNDVWVSERLNYTSLGFGIYLRFGFYYHSSPRPPFLEHPPTGSANLPTNSQLLVQLRHNNSNCQSVSVDYNCGTGQAVVTQNENVCIFN